MSPAMFYPEADNTKWVGAKNQRASRISEAEWKRHRRTLCKLYEENTLAVVMDIMRRRYGFRPSKRQLNYKFLQWGRNKYGKRPRNSESGSFADSSTIRDPFLVGTVDMLSPTPSAGTEDESMFFRDDGDASFPECGSYCPGDHSEGEAVLDADGVVDIEKPLLLTPVPLSSDDYKKKLAADFCSALSDDETAFQLYSSLCESALSRCDTSSDAGAIPGTVAGTDQVQSLLVSCVRSASQPGNARIARQLMDQYRARQAGSVRPFLFSMLDAYMQEREGLDGHDAASQRIGDIMSGVLGSGDGLVNLPHRHRCIDLVTYQFLSHGLDKYAERLRSRSGTSSPAHPTTFSPQGLLDQYVSRQPFLARLMPGAEPGRASSQLALHSCAQWCRKQLQRTDLSFEGPLQTPFQLPLLVPLEVQNIPGAPNHRRWAEDIQLFCTLWDAMLSGLQRDAAPPAWYVRSEPELGISPSELLVTMCWIIGDTEPTGPSFQLARTDPLPILDRARRNADVVALTSEQELWEAFLTKFTWMNKLVDLGPADQDFEASAAACIRAYVESALGIQLPASPQLQINQLSDGSDLVDMDFMAKLPSPAGFADPSVLGAPDGTMGGFGEMNGFLSAQQLQSLSGGLDDGLDLA